MKFAADVSSIGRGVSPHQENTMKTVVNSMVYLKDAIAAFDITILAEWTNEMCDDLATRVYALAKENWVQLNDDGGDLWDCARELRDAAEPGE